MTSSLRLSTLLVLGSVLVSCQPQDAITVNVNTSAAAQSSTRVVGPSSMAASSSSVASSAALTPPPASSAVVPPVIAEGNVQLSVPFAPQAPFANWDDLHQETCEEMSLIMVQRFLQRQSLTEQQAEEEVQKLVAWMTDNGYGWDVTVAELAEVARAYYDLDTRIIDDVSVELIVNELRAGNPVIVPAAGRELGNPYFSGEGPWYHMLVITGYKKSAFGERFVTNDPGTKRGSGYEYDADVLINAIHDWTGIKEQTSTGPKRMLVVE